MLPFVILAGENDIRVSEFQRALRSQGLLDAHVISYEDYLKAPEILLQTPASDKFILRIDSPGRDLKAQKQILKKGIEPLKFNNSVYESEVDIDKKIHDKGRIIAPHQFYHGYKGVLNELTSQLDANPNIHVMNHPSDIRLAFDKFECQRYLLQHGISVPKPLTQIHSYEQLRNVMLQEKIPRVFVKLKHGSSASGIVALETNKTRVQMKTTVETVVDKQGNLSLYNSRKIQYSSDEKEIETLINRLCEMEVQVERWIPKAQVDGYNVDMRVLMIAGKAQHKVLRMSKSPMTNLHLLNQRADIALLKDKMTNKAWESLINSCENVAKLFPRSLYIALDIVVSINLNKHYILEVNAFGDLLKNTFYKGLSPQEAQIDHIINKEKGITH